MRKRRIRKLKILKISMPNIEVVLCSKSKYGTCAGKDRALKPPASASFVHARNWGVFWDSSFMDDRTRKLSGYYVLLILVLMIQISCPHAAVGSIKQGESIRDGETLVSAGGVFELGFFSPGGSKNRYLGIWYKQITKQTVVWVANREAPLTDTTGVLTINDGGNLLLVDTRVGVFQSLFVPISRMNSSSAVLLDSGNFILSNEVGKVVWQSFDFPTDTFLPGMILGLDRRTGRSWSIVSWTSAEDPSTGSYSLKLDTNETVKFVIRHKDGSVFWTSGSWNGRIFSLVPEMTSKYIFNMTYVENDSMIYFSYNVYDSSILSRLVMGSSGQIRQMIWLNKSNEWPIFWSQPRDACEIYNACGANARCDISDVSTRCNCPQGFVVDPWKQNPPSCVRRRKLTCGDEVGFLEVANVRIPDRSRYVGDESVGDCKSRCRSNCSCTAYASAYSNGTSGCLFWTGDLIGLRDSPPYRVDDGFAMGNVYVRVAASDLVRDKPAKKRHIIIAVIATLIVISISCILCYLLRWRKLRSKGEAETSKGLLSFELSINLSAAKKLVEASNLRHGQRSRDLPFFSLAAVEAATDNFSPANKLGQGGFGPVYKGKLAGGQEVAMKRLSRSSGQGLEEFKNEVMVISRVQHRNLVKLLGWCAHGEEKILIYEYMPNKSLDSYLFDETKKSKLDWGIRVLVIEGIAQGLLYLHRFSQITVIHRDLKASNILLDDNMNPKISDFGMARIFGSDQSQANTMRVVGTYGYMSPEYIMEGIFSVKSDVFSFGVLLLEVVSGKKSAAARYIDGSLNLLGYAWELWKDGKISEVIDPMLVDSAPAHELARYVHVALLCVQNSSIDRPNMAEVVHMLTNKTAPLGTPKQPAFTVQRVAETDASPGRPITCSVNEVTVTEVNEGR